MKIKHDVNLTGLKPEMLLGIMVVDSVYTSAGFDCVVTSISDGKHGRSSKHYIGNAADFRTSNIPQITSHINTLVTNLKESLGPQFDVVFEGDHIHVEYDPK